MRSVRQKDITGGAFSIRVSDFRDAANAVVPNEGKEKLKHVLTEEEYSEITAGTEFKISWYFWKKK